MTFAPVTLLYGGLSALLLTALAVAVSTQRARHKSFIGDEQPVALARFVRAHGNASEYIPIGILLLLLLEQSNRTGSLALHILGGSFFLGRFLHALGVITKSKLAQLGITINYLGLAVMSVWAIVLHFSG